MTRQKVIGITLFFSCLLLLLVYTEITEMADQARSFGKFQLPDEGRYAENGTIKVHQSLLSNIISEQSRKLPLFLKDVIPSPDDHNIYQILTTKLDIMKMRHYCSLESYCLQNPKSKVWFLILGLDILDGEAMQVLGALEQSYPNLRLAKIDMDLIVRGTPLEPIVSSGRLQKSVFQANHLSDVIRLAVVSKAGGMYTDFDFICLRSVYEVRNFVAKARPHVVTNAVFNFDKGHAFLKILMEDDEKNFDGTNWGTNGPLLFTRVVEKHCPNHTKNPAELDINLGTLVQGRLNYLSHLSPGAKVPNESMSSRSSTESKEEELCDSFKLFDTNAFVPFYYGKMIPIFEKDTAYKIQGIPASSYAIHLFNKITKEKTVETNSGVEIVARVYCPLAFTTSITEQINMR